jgi:hypothetical protein
VTPLATLHARLRVAQPSAVFRVYVLCLCTCRFNQEFKLGKILIGLLSIAIKSTLGVTPDLFYLFDISVEVLAERDTPQDLNIFIQIFVFFLAMFGHI